MSKILNCIEIGQKGPAFELAKQILGDAAEMATLLGKDAFFFREEDHHGIEVRVTVELADGDEVEPKICHARHRRDDGSREPALCGAPDEAEPLRMRDVQPSQACPNCWPLMWARIEAHQAAVHRHLLESKRLALLSMLSDGKVIAFFIDAPGVKEVEESGSPEDVKVIKSLRARVDSNVDLQKALDEVEGELAALDAKDAGAAAPEAQPVPGVSAALGDDLPFVEKESRPGVCLTCGTPGTVVERAGRPLCEACHGREVPS